MTGVRGVSCPTMGNRGPKLSPCIVKQLAEYTHFSPKELQYWYKKFLEDCPSGSLSLQEFQVIFIKHFSFTSSKESSLMELARLLFNALEKDSDGMIGFGEFIRSFSTVLSGTHEEQLSWLFNLCDQDKNGFVSRNEVAHVVTVIYQCLGALVDCSSNELPPKTINNLFQEEGEINVYKEIGQKDFTKMFLSESFIKASNICHALGIEMEHV
jgi:Ca2+-binding EF-hand superfamily protein